MSAALRISAAFLLGLFISSLIIVPGHAALGDPDDDSWSASDGSGLSGSSTDDWSIPSESERATPLEKMPETGGDSTMNSESDLVEVPAKGGSTPVSKGDSDGDSDDTDDGDDGVGDVDFSSTYGSGSESDDDESDSDDYTSDVSDYSFDDIGFTFSYDDDIQTNLDEIDLDFDDTDFDFDDIDLGSDIDDIWLDDDDYYGYRKRGNRYYEIEIDEEDEGSSTGRGRGKRRSRSRGRGKYRDIDYDYDDSDDEDDTDYDYSTSQRGNRRRNRYDDVDFDEDSDDVGVGRGRGRNRFKVSDYEMDSDPDFDLGDSDSDPDFDLGDDEDTDFGYSRRRGGRENRGESGGRGRSKSRGGGKRRIERAAVQTRSSKRGSDSIEIEDGTASPDEIPKGYFKGQEPQPTGGNRRRVGGGVGGIGVVSGSVDLPGFRLVISEPTMWWKYDLNVCLNKEYLEQTLIEDEGINYMMTSVRCTDGSTTEYSCNVTHQNTTAITVYRLTYTCCRGFTRLVTDRGCPRRMLRTSETVQSFEALLRRHGFSPKIIDLFNTVLTNDTKKQWTVFLPSKSALEEAVRQVDFMESKEEPVPEWFVRTMLNHFVQPAISTSSMANGQVLKTLYKSGSGLFITKTMSGETLVNCKAIALADQPFNNYSLAHFVPSVLSVQENNIFQLMLKRLEGVVPVETAGKLLAPLKALLTGATKPVTVFMHLPFKEEIDNNCYARNLRSAIFQGAQCNSSLLSSKFLLTIDGKRLRLTREKGRIVINDDRQVTGAEQVASNGVLYFVNATNSMVGFTNEVIRKLKGSESFKPLFTRPDGSLGLLIPPHNGSYTYANTSARWENATLLAQFGRRHLFENVTALVGRGSRLGMLDGAQRDFAQVDAWQESSSIFGPDRLVRYRFVDCVRIVQTAKDCSGTIYYFLKGALPDFYSSQPVLEYLRRRRTSTFSIVKKILGFALEQNKTELSNRLGQNDTSIVLLKDTDMHLLTGELFTRRRKPTTEQLEKLTLWFSKYLVASKQICAAKSVAPSLMVPIFQSEQRSCRSIICSFRRRVEIQLRRVQLRPESRIIVREGFLLPGQL